MNIEQYTDRAKGFIQSAQGLAVREGHQQFSAEHLLKVLLDDPEGLAAGLIDKSGGQSRSVLAAVERALAKRPKVSGGAAGQLYLAPELARVFDQAEKIAEKAGDRFVTAERLLLAIAVEGQSDAARALKDAGVTPQGLNGAINDVRKGRTADTASAEQGYDALKRYARDLTRSGRQRQDRSGHRPRRGDPPHHPGALPPHQEQPRAHRRARRRQDRHRRRPGAAHRQRRRAGEPEGQARCLSLDMGALDRGRQVPRRVRGAPEGRAEGGRPQARAASSCSSTSCTPSSAPARPRARWTPATCSSRCWRAASCTASARPRSTSTASTSRRTPRLARRFQPVFVDEPTVEDTISILRGLKERYEMHHGVRITDGALVVGGRAVQSLHHRPLPARQGDRPRRRGGVAPDAWRSIRCPRSWTSIDRD